MQIVVIAEGLKQNEFHDKGIAEGIQVQFVTSIQDAHTADACFYLLDETMLHQDIIAIGERKDLVFVNAVCTTLDQLPGNCVRVNAWPGFLLSQAIEIAAGDKNKPAAAKVLNTLKWAYHFVPDICGMIAPRTIAMIINEAYYALGEDVSTKEDIDIAMKLGTGYPYGPFEWSRKIGLQNIHGLLSSLAEDDPRYQPAPLLTQESAE